MPTDPLTASRYPASTAVPNVNQDIQNAVIDLSDNTNPNFATTTARDNAYTAWVALGNTMWNGMVCSVNGIPYRRIGGVWRENRQRGFPRTVTIGGGGSIIAGGAAESGVTSGYTALTSLTLYEAGQVMVLGTFRGNPSTSAFLFAVKVDGAAIGIQGVIRTDVQCMSGGLVTLAAGSHTIAARADNFGGVTGTWTSARIDVWELAAE